MSDDLRQRQQLLKIGTARAGRAPAPPAAPLDALFPQAQASEAESTLWLSLGALDLWERSGFVPPAAPPQTAPDPAPPEDLRPCPPRAEAILPLLLGGLYPASLQAEWLRLLQRHGGHLPPRFLPRLLDTATRQPALRAQLLPVLGERGRWLARMQSEWAWATNGATDEEASWDTGTPEQRLLALRTWRARDPQAARDALAAAWPSEAPEQRAALLPALGVRLSLADEAILEAALDDRRKEVRMAAQRLLASLPGSQLGQRMLAHLLPLLRVEKPWLGKARIELTLPETCDAAMRRDGIGVSAHPGMGEKAGWVVDMLAAVDPHVWEKQFERSPRECLALADNSEFRAVLMRGWSLAALRELELDAASEQQAWPQELALWWVGADIVRREAVPGAMLGAFAARFHDNAGGASIALLDALPDHWSGDPELLQLLHRLADQSQDTWTPALTRSFLQRLQAIRPSLMKQGQLGPTQLLLSPFAKVADPAVATAAEADWRASIKIDSEWRPAIARFFDLVRLRHEMILSFQEPA
ncbi:hypothetical protein SRABI118_05165 [Massilia sp. Bi118]|uniref:DUF5691 domain-containing protein n=1 Tax=Massilia sp. Bi118 TaxID=2822346 RepID=UPI001DA78B9B|nr:DUF5691 domain-containing protein [Massilia sp. Bi118]CAH0318893.1 hypothetical protein SRABI118_05165 [Massilia sp. Bi118]